MSESQITQRVEGKAARAADRLFQTFVDMIETGELRDGDALPPEREIVERYNVSRTVVREAVQALANRGLVEARPRFRPVVRSASYETAVDTVGDVVKRLLKGGSGVRNLFETRILVEAGLVREAAKSATSSQLSDLALALQVNREAIDDSHAFYETDRAFHRLFYEFSGNPVLIATHKAFVEWLSPHWEKMGHHSERNARNFKAHEAIFEAVRTGDADAAETALRQHLSDAWDQVKNTFD